MEVDKVAASVISAWTFAAFVNLRDFFFFEMIPSDGFSFSFWLLLNQVSLHKWQKNKRKKNLTEEACYVIYQPY